MQGAVLCWLQASWMQARLCCCTVLLLADDGKRQ
jgi:hypothetical protein